MGAVFAAIDAHAVSSFILGWVGQALLFGTSLAAATWLLTKLLRQRVRPAFEAVLWAIVLVKFLAPVGPQWSLSLATAYQQVPRCWSRSGDDGSASPAAVVGRATPTYAEAEVASEVGRCRAPGSSPPWPWTTFIAAGYLAGMLCLLVVRLRSQWALLARCRRLPPADEATCRLVLGLCRRLGVQRAPSVRLSDESPAPFVMGSISPLLVLSHRQLVRPNELETVIVHELAHLRRGDVFVRYLQWLAGTLLFFWPVVAWVNRRLDVAREHACDEWALKHGRLTPGEYARCLLRAMQPAPAGRFAYCPAGMAINHKNIERRIDMIFKSPRRSGERRTKNLLAAAFLLGWGGFALTGAADPSPPDGVSQRDWPATAEALTEHAILLYNQVAQRNDADLNGDGELAYCEKSTYLVALAAQEADAFIEEFPFADRDHNGVLDNWEAHDAIRGITLIAYADRRPTAAPGAAIDFEFYHVALDAQQWLLDNVTAKPSADDLANARAIVALSSSPRSGHARALNHGGPEQAATPAKHDSGDTGRFKELEGSIASLQAKLAIATDAEEIARLQAMLAKLEALLAKLEGA